MMRLVFYGSLTDGCLGKDLFRPKEQSMLGNEQHLVTLEPVGLFVARTFAFDNGCQDTRLCRRYFA
ncbi:hypothetical protein AD948_12030 [Acetobacter senegalensis]|uniref:Uncharacterized protein n=1 Tax=Acetobacter senegalensis TaxID=446692 RepID=A0A149TYI3_9PROT|nr:hypothetical protein AD948_12030 [Acetobacter senegalensis]